MRLMWSACIASASLLLLSACGGDEGECRTDSYPAAPDGASSTLYVSAGCPAEGADGSAEHPFPTIAAALAAAGKGAAVLIAPGTYTDNLEITQDVALVGSSDPTRAEAAAAVVEAAGDNAITVTGAEAVTLRGLRVVRALRAGILVRSAAVTIEGCSVEGTAPGANGAFGYGVAATDDGSIILQNSAITGSARIGLLVSGARGIILQSTIRGSGSAGVRVDQATDEVRIEGNTIEDNAQLGVGIFSSRAIILQNVIRGTQLDAAGIADGVLVAGLKDQSGADLGYSDVELSDNEISGNGRVGILCAAGARGIILQNNTIGGNGAEAPFGAGIWLQGSAGGAAENLIDGNIVASNNFVGIGMTGETHGIILQNNTISGTQLGTAFAGANEIQVGDGIGLFAGASAAVLGNTVEGNGRFGLILDAANGPATSIQGNTFQDNDQYGIILQNQPSAPTTDGNTFSGNQAGDLDNVAAGTYGVRTEAFATN